MSHRKARRIDAKIPEARHGGDVLKATEVAIDVRVSNPRPACLLNGVSSLNSRPRLKTTG
jgi:hypothetical protein